MNLRRKKVENMKINRNVYLKERDPNMFNILSLNKYANMSNSVVQQSPTFLAPIFLTCSDGGSGWGEGMV